MMQQQFNKLAKMEYQMAEPGERVTYHKGMIAMQRNERRTPHRYLLTPFAEDIGELADFFLNEFENGNCMLLQKKRSEFQYDYIAVKV